VRAIEPRFNDPGDWFTCTGTLLSPTVVVRAGHCTFGTGTDGEPTSGGSGGNDVSISLAEAPRRSPTRCRRDRDARGRPGTDRGRKCVGEP
jgi:hypothetical protein